MQPRAHARAPEPAPTPNAPTPPPQLFLRSAGSDASERTVYSGTVKKSVTIKGGENPN
jgi:hypothetical protein